jgi:hypothetical protein
MAALGDPMWDLAFLVGADRDLDREEVRAVVQEYGRLAPVDAYNLSWHRRSWEIFWKIRDLAMQPREGTE